MGRPHPQITHFSRKLDVPGENVHFHYPGAPKTQTFRLFPNFSRHASSLNDTDQSKARKIRIFCLSVQIGTRLRGTPGGPDPSHQSGIQDSCNVPIQEGNCGAGLHRATGDANHYTNFLRHAFTSSLKQKESSFRGKINPSFSVVVSRIKRTQNTEILIT